MGTPIDKLSPIFYKAYSNNIPSIIQSLRVTYLCVWDSLINKDRKAPWPTQNTHIKDDVNLGLDMNIDIYI